MLHTAYQAVSLPLKRLFVIRRILISFVIVIQIQERIIRAVIEKYFVAIIFESATGGGHVFSADGVPYWYFCLIILRKCRSLWGHWAKEMF